MLDGSYSCSASDLETYLDEMLFQKRVEFWGEGVHKNRAVTRIKVSGQEISVIEEGKVYY